MAIINCPECNGSVSDTVQHCIHCGYKINFCPECKTLLKENIASCPECGYVFVNEDKTDHSKEDPFLSKAGIHVLYKQWETGNILTKLQNIKSWVVIFIEVLLLFAIYWILKHWLSLITVNVTNSNISDILDILDAATSGYTKTINTLTMLSIIFVAIIVINAIVNVFWERAKSKDFKQWYTSKELDINHSIATSLKDGLSKMSDQHLSARKFDLEASLKYVAFEKYENLSYKQTLFRVLNVIANFISSSLFMYGIVDNMIAYMESYLYYDWASFASIPKPPIISNWTPIIMLGVALLVHFAILWISSDFSDKVQDRYVKENISECYSLYRRYIMDDTSYFPKDE